MRTRSKTVESWGDNPVPDPHGHLVVNGVTLTSACGAAPLSPSPTAAAHSPQPTPPEATYHSPRSHELPALRPQLLADDHRSREVRPAIAQDTHDRGESPRRHRGQGCETSERAPARPWCEMRRGDPAPRRFL